MKNEYKITKELMKSWAKEYHLHGKANIILFALWCVLGGCGLLGLVIALSIYRDWLSICLFVLFLLVAVYKLFFARFIVWNQRYKVYSKAYGVSEWIRSYEFMEDCIIFTDHTSISKLKYDHIVGIKEKNNIAMILFHDNMAVRLYKNAFVEGSWEECKKMLVCKSKNNGHL